MRQSIVSAVLLAFLLPVGVNAQMERRGVFQIPFAFVAADTEFSAGECTLFRASVSVGRIRCAASSNTSFLHLTPGSTVSRSELSKYSSLQILRFQRVGNQYFLREYQEAGVPSTFTVRLAPRREDTVTMMLASNQPSDVIVLAALR
jgi:hypothetical protein